MIPVTPTIRSHLNVVSTDPKIHWFDVVWPTLGTPALQTSNKKIHQTMNIILLYLHTALLCTNAAIHPLRCSIDFDCWTFILIVKKFKRPTQSSNEIPKAWKADSSKQQFSLHFEWKVGDREREIRERECAFSSIVCCLKFQHFYLHSTKLIVSLKYICAHPRKHITHFF